MNIYKELTPKECALRILSTDKPAVFIHIRPDGDAVGSAVALCEVFRQLGRDYTLHSSDPIPERLKFITDMLSLSVSEPADGRAPIAIDVASPAQLGPLYEKTSEFALMIDHHEIGTRFADGYVAPRASSAAEALMDIIKELEKLGKIEFTPTLAYALFAAMSSDTGCFKYSNATAKTHRFAAELIEKGIDTADINHRLFTLKTKEQIKAEGYIASKIESAACGRVAYATLTLEELCSLGLKQEHFDTAVDVVRSLYGADIALYVKETEKGKYKASLRSNGASVASVAMKFGGGGHVRAAGCSVSAESIEEAKDLVLSEIINLIG